MKTRAWDGKRWRTDYVIMPNGTIRRTFRIDNGVEFMDCYEIAERVNWKLSRLVYTDGSHEYWEGDICKVKGFRVIMQDKYPHGPDPIEIPFEHVIVVNADNPYRPIFDIGEGGPDIEVLGNIFENPELLEVK